MEIEQHRKIQLANFLVMTVMLAAIGVGLAWLTHLAMQAAGQVTEAREHKLLGRLAWLAMALLGMVCVLWFWVLVRFLRMRAILPRDKTATDYVDAWSLAGKRYELTEDDNVIEPDDEDDQP